jgi:hypothetical protein
MNTLMPTTPDQFSLAYDAEQHLLIGAWLSDTEEDDLYPSYERLLAAAHAHDKCRFWLLDMRKRSWHSVAFARWFGNLLAHQVVRELGSPVFVAYVAEETHRVDIEGVASDAMLRQTAQVEFYPYYFDNEQSAREWLVYYRTHPDQTPGVPS